MFKKQLFVRLKKSDEIAFKKLFEMYYPKVKSFLIASNLKKDLDDILQETFIIIWNKRENIDLKKSFDSYIFTIAKNLALKNLQKQIMYDIESLKIEVKDSTIPIDKMLDIRLYDKKIRSLIANLPPQLRTVFQMKRFEGLTTKEVAQKMGISPKTVENYMNSALSSLKKELRFSVSLILLFFQ